VCCNTLYFASLLGVFCNTFGCVETSLLQGILAWYFPLKSLSSPKSTIWRNSDSSVFCRANSNRKQECGWRVQTEDKLRHIPHRPKGKLLSITSHGARRWRRSSHSGRDLLIFRPHKQVVEISHTQTTRWYLTHKQLVDISHTNNSLICHTHKL